MAHHRVGRSTLRPCDCALRRGRMDGCDGGNLRSKEGVAERQLLCALRVDAVRRSNSTEAWQGGVKPCKDGAELHLVPRPVVKGAKLSQVTGGTARSSERVDADADGGVASSPPAWLDGGIIVDHWGCGHASATHGHERTSAGVRRVQHSTSSPQQQ